jgi:oxygen-dependent protoporphyrinogen oxidase
VTRLADGSAIRSCAVVLAMPAPVASGVVTRLDIELTRLCAGIRYAPSLSVALGYRAGDIRHPLDGWGLVVPRRERRHLGAVTWVTSKWPSRAPAGHVPIRTSLSRGCGADAMDASDEQVRAWAQDDLRWLVGVTRDPVLAKVYRRPIALPQLEVGHLDRMAAIDGRLSRLPGLFISAAGFRGVGLPDCIADARATARRAAAFLDARPV